MWSAQPVLLFFLRLLLAWLLIGLLFESREIGFFRRVEFRFLQEFFRFVLLLPFLAPFDGRLQVSLCWAQVLLLACREIGLGELRGLGRFGFFLEGLLQPPLVQDDYIVPAGKPFLSALVGLVLECKNIGQLDLILVVDVVGQLDCHYSQSFLYWGLGVKGDC